MEAVVSFMSDDEAVGEGGGKPAADNDTRRSACLLLITAGSHN